MLTCRHTTGAYSARRQPAAELVDVVDQVDLFPAAIHQLVGKPQAKGRPRQLPVPLFPGMSALMAAVRRATGRLSLRERPSEPQLRLQLATEKHRLTRSCACLLFLQPWLSNPRTRSPLPGRRRFWHRFIRDIRVVRCRTGSPSACRRCLGFLNRVYRLRWCCW